MSYDIYIGQLENGRVGEIFNPDAPLFSGDEMTGQSNGRHPGYRQWDEFCREAGIFALFFGSNGLMVRHPGSQLLKTEHLDVIKNALEKRKKLINLTPGWCNCQKCDSFFRRNNNIKHVEYDNILARLLWLEYWVDWALKNCDCPSVYNC